MTVWDELKVALLDLEAAHALTGYPDPRSDAHREPPFEIHLAAWATDAAEDLHRRFGDDVGLIVGVLRYPERQPGRQHPTAPDDIPDMDPALMNVELDAPIIVSSGHNATGALRISNLSAANIVIFTNGHVTAQVVDPHTRMVVGGAAGIEHLVSVEISVASGGTLVVPLVVGTASYLPELSYAVPAGEWAIQAVLSTQDGHGGGWQRPTDRPPHRRVRTPLLPITVTA
jgi:hypothetical protein